MQQAHTQLLAKPVNSAEALSPWLQELSDLPFRTLTDLMEWEAQIGDDKHVRLQMVRMLCSNLQLSFGKKNQEEKSLKKFFGSVLHVKTRFLREKTKDGYGRVCAFAQRRCTAA